MRVLLRLVTSRLHIAWVCETFEDIVDMDIS